MATILLVAGAYQGGWCYEKLVPLLKEAGHDVLTPDLSGLASRRHLADMGTINLETHINDIVNLIEGCNLRDVVLCGHSYAGLVITAVADRLTDRVSTLVYLDAELPTKTGDTLFSLFPELVPLTIGTCAELGGFMLAPVPSAAFGTAQEHQAWVDARQTPQPLSTFTQQVTLTGAHHGVPKRVLIYNARDIGFPTPMPGWYEAYRGNARDHVYGIDSSHLMMIDSPQEVARIILEHA